MNGAEPGVALTLKDIDVKHSQLKDSLQEIRLRNLMLSNLPEWLSQSPRRRRRMMTLWRALLRVQRARLAVWHLGTTRKDDRVLPKPLLRQSSLSRISTDGSLVPRKFRPGLQSGGLMRRSLISFRSTDQLVARASPLQG